MSRTDGTTIRETNFAKHRATASAPTQVCGHCDMKRSIHEFRDSAGREYKACGMCRGRHPELRKALK